MASSSSSMIPDSMEHLDYILNHHGYKDINILNVYVTSQSRVADRFEDTFRLFQNGNIEVINCYRHEPINPPGTDIKWVDISLVTKPSTFVLKTCSNKRNSCTWHFQFKDITLLQPLYQRIAGLCKN
jgi:hypothetical protein